MQEYTKNELNEANKEQIIMEFHEILYEVIKKTHVYTTEFCSNTNGKA